MWSCCKDHPRVLGPASVCAWSLAALELSYRGLLLGTLEASTPCPGCLLATGMGRRTEERAGFCCLSLRGIGASIGAQRPALPCPGFARSSSRLGVLGQGPQKGLVAFQASKVKAASGEGALAAPASLWLHPQSRAAHSLDFLESLCCRAGAELAPCCGTWGWVQAPPKPGLSAGAAAGGWPWALLSPPGPGQGPSPSKPAPKVLARAHTAEEQAGEQECRGARSTADAESIHALLLCLSQKALQQAKGARRGAVLQFKPSLGRKSEWAGAGGPRSDVLHGSPCAVGLELGTAGVQRCCCCHGRRALAVTPHRQTLPARAQGAGMAAVPSGWELGAGSVRRLLHSSPCTARPGRAG